MLSIAMLALITSIGCGEALDEDTEDSGANGDGGGGGDSVTDVSSLTVAFEGETISSKDAAAVPAPNTNAAYNILVADTDVGCSARESSLDRGESSFIRIPVPSKGSGSWSGQPVRWRGKIEGMSEDSINGTAEVGAVEIQSVGTSSVSGNVNAAFDFKTGGDKSRVAGAFTVEKCF